MQVVEPMSAGNDRQLRAELDEELNLLPDHHRVPLVLCYLEGKTHEEAAHLVGCPPGSMSWRLERAREALRARLAQRGIPCFGLAAIPFSEATSAVSAELSAELVQATAKAASLFASGGAGISDSVASLTEEVLRSMTPRRPRWVLPVVVAITLAALASAAWAVTPFVLSFLQPQQQQMPCHEGQQPAGPGGVVE